MIINPRKLTDKEIIAYQLPDTIKQLSAEEQRKIIFNMRQTAVNSIDKEMLRILYCNLIGFPAGNGL